MTSRMTRSEAKSWQSRWEVVEALKRRELRAMPLEEKLRQTAQLMAMGHGFGVVRPSPEGLTETQARWVRLKARLGA